MLKQVNSWISKNSNAYKAYKTQLDAILNSLSSNSILAAQELQQVRTAFTQIVTEATKAGKTGATLADIIKSRWKALVAYLTTFTSFYDFVRYGRNYVTMIQEFDTALTEMRKVSDETVESLRDFQKESFGIADSIGSTALVIQNSTADWMRLGESIEEAKESAKDASILLNVSEFSSIDEATESLVSMSQAYSDMDKMDIIDKLNNIGNNYSISTDKLATGLQNAAAVLKTQGNDIDESIALLTAANSVVQDISKASTGLRTISLRIAGTEEAKAELQALGEDVEDYIVQTASKTQKTIKDYTATALNPEGVDVLDDNGNLRDTYNILLDIAEVYKTIQEEDKEFGTNRANALVEYIAGKNRSNIAASILNDPDLLRDVYESSQNSEGSAMEENEKYLDSIEGRLNVLKNRWQEIWASDEANQLIKDIIGLLQNSLDSKGFDEIEKAVTGIINLFDLLVNHIEILQGVLASLGFGLGVKGVIGLRDNILKLVDSAKEFLEVSESFAKVEEITKNIGGNEKNGISSLWEGINNNGIAGSLEDYRNALSGLSAENAALVLSQNGATEAQARQILMLKNGQTAIQGLSAEETELIIKQTQWSASTATISEANWEMFLNTELLTTTLRDQLVAELELQSVEGGGAISKNKLTASAILESQALKSLNYETRVQIAEILGLSIAEDKATISTYALAGAFSRLWKFLLSNPFVLIAAGVGIATYSIINHDKKIKELHEDVSELTKEYEKQESTLNKNVSSFKKLSERYSVLSKGVNSLGENIGLSTDEFEEYHDVTNQIAEMIPSLIKGWDEEGNAILAVKDTVVELTDAYKKEQDAAYNTIINSSEDIYKDRKNSINKNNFIDGINYNEAYSEIEKLLNIKDYALDDLSYFSNDIMSLNYILDDALGMPEYITDAEQMVDYLNNLSEEQRSALETYIINQEVALSEAAEGSRKLFDAYLGKLILDDDTLPDSIKSVLNNLAENVSDITLLAEDDLGEFAHNIYDAFKDLTDSELNDIELGINLTTQWNNDEISFTEYVEKIGNLDLLLNDIFDGNEELIKAFGGKEFVVYDTKMRKTLEFLRDNN